MVDNLRHWSALEKTDPTATKSFSRAGGFRGTATKPIYQEKKMTEHFGPCGVGWGMEKPEFQLVPTDGEIVVFCTIALWYKDDDESKLIYGVGGDKVVAKRGDGAFVNDEAFKAAFTDALGNAMKHIGVGADVHMGEFDGSKYNREEPAPRSAPAPRASAAPAPQPAPPSGETPFDSPPAPIANGRVSDQKLREAAEARDRIRAALLDAKEPRLIEDIITLNSADLRVIKEVGPKTYESLMTLANGRKQEMLAGA